MFMAFLMAGNPRYVNCFYKRASPSWLLPRALLEPTGFLTYEQCVHSTQTVLMETLELLDVCSEGTAPTPVG